MFHIRRTDIGGDLFHGILHRPHDCKTLTVHVHGTGGDFYSNPFIEPMACEYRKHGIGYISANFPGMTDSYKTERFADFPAALDRWIASLDWDGALILQGHSLGALKVLRYHLSRQGKYSSRIIGLVLLAPFDIVAFYSSRKPEEVSHIETQLNEFAIAEGGNSLVPSSIFDIWPISAGTMKSLISPGNDADCFDSRNALTTLRNMPPQVPTFVAVGSEDVAAFPNAKAVVTAATSLDNVTAHVIEGAPHNFEGRVHELTSRFSSWLQGERHLTGGQ